MPENTLQLKLILSDHFTSFGHLEAAHYATKSSYKWSGLESFLHFPAPEHILSMGDANWGPQDSSQSKTTIELPLFASLLNMAFYINLLGPILTGCLSIKQLLLVVHLKLKSMPQMNVLSS